MALQSLLLCPDEKTARVLSRVLGELEIGMEQCTEPFDAVKKLMRQRYDAVIVDWENEANATLVLKNARMSPSNKTSLAVAIVEGQTSVRNAFRAGANFVLYKPISVEQAKTSLRAARALMQRGAEAAARQGGEATAPGPTLVPPQTGSTAPSNLPPRTPTIPPSSPPFGAPSMSAANAGWGNTAAGAAPARDGQAPTPLDDLRNLASSALDNFKATAEPMKATTTVAEPAPTRPAAEVKPFPTGVKPRKKEEEGDYYHLDLDADPAADSRSKRPAGKVTEVQSAVELPRAINTAANRVTPLPPAAAIQPLKPTSEPAMKSGVSFEEVRSRVSAQAPRSVPSFGMEVEAEEKSAGIPKPVLLGGVGVIVVAVAVFAILHFRAAPKPQPVAQTAPQPVATQAAAPGPVAEPTNVNPVALPPSVPVKTEIQGGKEVSVKPSAGKSGQPAETATGEEEPALAQPPPEVHKLAAIEKPKPAVEVAEAAPPSLGTVSGSTDAGLVGGIVRSSVVVPKLVAPDRVRVSQGVSQGMLIKMVQPAYPELARSMHLQGSVVLEVLIGKTGSVKNLKVLKGHPMLAHAALEAVKQWRYKPYLLNGQPVSVETQITVKFTL